VLDVEDRRFAAASWMPDEHVWFIPVTSIEHPQSRNQQDCPQTVSRGAAAAIFGKGAILGRQYAIFGP
jgi:hypothetical protein